VLDALTAMAEQLGINADNYAQTDDGNAEAVPGIELNL
jgi:hypothetical protein